MHKYQPRIHLIMRRDPNTANLPITDLESENYRTFVFPETVFTAVTGRLSSEFVHLTLPMELVMKSEMISSDPNLRKHQTNWNSSLSFFIFPST